MQFVLMQKCILQNYVVYRKNVVLDCYFHQNFYLLNKHNNLAYLVFHLHFPLKIINGSQTKLTCGYRGAYNGPIYNDRHFIYVTSTDSYSGKRADCFILYNIIMGAIYMSSACSVRSHRETLNCILMF